MNNADAAMHHAKRSASGRPGILQEIHLTRAAKRLSLEADLRKALERQEFTLNYQPRLALKTLEVEAVEALLRWSHPQRGMVPPDEFIPLAEQSGLIVEIGDWVLREACAQARRWGAADTAGAGKSPSTCRACSFATGAWFAASPTPSCRRGSIRA